MTEADCDEQEYLIRPVFGDWQKPILAFSNKGIPKKFRTRELFPNYFAQTGRFFRTLAE
jgi:hypothetical protein